jgi:hypothetical protein
MSKRSTAGKSLCWSLHEGKIYSLVELLIVDDSSGDVLERAPVTSDTSSAEKSQISIADFSLPN